MAERIRTQIQRRIDALVEKHEAYDPHRPTREWKQEPLTDKELDEAVISLVDAYDRVAPHLPRTVAIALRNMVRKHPKLRLRGEDHRHPDNYITPDGEPFYWGGVRKDPHGNIVPGGRGPYPLALHRYLQTREGQARNNEGEAVFYRLDSAEGRKVARAGLRKKISRDTAAGQAVRKKAQKG